MYFCISGYLLSTPSTEHSGQEKTTQRVAPTRQTLNDLEYADDLVVFEADPARFAEVTTSLDETCKDWGSEISTIKTRWMYISPTLNDDRELPDLFICAEKLERVHEFCIWVVLSEIATHWGYLKMYTDE